MLYPQILKLDIAGVPLKWIRWEDAACLYARNRVRWEAGEERLRVYGGFTATGERSSLDICSIIAVDERVRRRHDRPPPLTNRALFQRDGHRCMYCGGKFSVSQLSRDHVLPRARGGADTWRNVVTACRSCNQKKDDRLLEDIPGMALLGVPYEPDPAKMLLLVAGGRHVLADQQKFLESLSQKWTARGGMN